MVATQEKTTFWKHMSLCEGQWERRGSSAVESTSAVSTARIRYPAYPHFSVESGSPRPIGTRVVHSRAVLHAAFCLLRVVITSRHPVEPSLPAKKNLLSLPICKSCQDLIEKSEKIVAAARGLCWREATSAADLISCTKSAPPALRGPACLTGESWPANELVFYPNLINMITFAWN